FPGHSNARAAPNPDLLNFGAAEFRILDPRSGQVIGHARYTLEHAASGDLLHGENRYFDGSYDVEKDTIEAPSPGATPVLVGFEHLFFDPDGSPTFSERLNLKSGEASCIRYKHDVPETLAANLDFPPDTYPGASLLIPVEYGLRGDRSDTIRLHVFACVPGPRVLEVEAQPREGARSPSYGADVLAVDVRPTLGWWDLLIEPFLPKARAWFDPTDSFSYLGGKTERFYRGPWVELVREPNKENGGALSA